MGTDAPTGGERMTDHWQVIEFALRSNLADLTQGDDLYAPEQREIKRAEYDAALAFVRQQTVGQCGRGRYRG